VEFRKFPDEVMAVFQQYSEEVVSDMVSSDPISQKAYASYKKFQDQITDYSQYNEKI
jgi:TRAP-type mannitol/chloroaromatic compound transport system substrate-binding protein